MKNLFLFAVILSLFSCNSKDGGITIHTSGIFSPVLFSIDGKDASGKTLDLGEYVLTDGPRTMVIKVHNSTNFPYTDLELLMSADGENSPSVSFNPNPDGAATFPGFEGTCSQTLLPGQSCEIRTILYPRDERKYLETLTLNFKNYIGPESHVAHLKFLAGMPASLVFTNDQAFYVFGEEVGTPPLPVIERAEAISYVQELEIRNAGGLYAHNIDIILNQTCISSTTGSCPAGMSNVYVVDTDCPKSLGPKQECRATVTYSPKNQDPASGPVPDDIKEISYNSNLSFNYEKDPKGSPGGLVAYFKSVSTNIEARFKVGVNTISLENPVISGNRESRSFKVNNKGYREGEIRAIIFRDSSGAFMARCLAGSSEFLSCQNNVGEVLSLAQFPFTLKDRDACITQPGDEPKYVKVDSGCTFDITFQPSVTFLDDILTDYQNLQPEIEYDARWRGEEKIVTSKLFDYSVVSKAAARMVLKSVSYLGSTYTDAGNSPWNIDLGRLTLQSSTYFKRKSLIITFTNVGSIEATNLSFEDAFGRKFAVGETVHLGAYSQEYYKNVTASASSCTMVQPGADCSITIQFAPIGRNPPEQEDANMFDAVDELGDKYKGFRLTYTSGAKFQDTNIHEAPDYPPLTVEARLKATLVRKGMLMDLSDDPDNKSTIGANVVATGDTIQTHLFLTNIGTGSIPYIRLLNPPLPAYQEYNFSLIPTTDLGQFGRPGLVDCLDLVDIDETATVSPEHMPSYSPTDPVLGVDKSCVFTVQFKPDEARYLKASKLANCGNTVPYPLSADEGKRYFRFDKDSRVYCGYLNQNISWQDIIFSYFDGDKTAPGADSTDFGNRFTLNPFAIQLSQNQKGYLTPYDLNPWFSASLYRPAFSYTFPDRAPINVSENWFFGTANFFYTQSTEVPANARFTRAWHSKIHAQTLPNFLSSIYNVDYILYLGSFTQAAGDFNVPVRLSNAGNRKVKILNYSLDQTAGGNSFQLLTPPGTPPYQVDDGSSTTFNFNFNPSSEGEHALFMELEYETGRHLSTLVVTPSSAPQPSNIGSATRETESIRVLVLADVMKPEDHPQLSLEVIDYEVNQTPGVAPVPVPGTPYVHPLSWDTKEPSTPITFDTIKLTAAPKTDDVYAQKLLKFTNNSDHDLQDFSYDYRANGGSYQQEIISPNFKIKPASTCLQGMTLPAGQSCEMLIVYQPNSSDETSNFLMTFIYKVKDGIYLMQNLGVELMPRSPGQVIAAGGKKTVTIKYKSTPTSQALSRASYGLAAGTSNTLNTIPKIKTFEKMQFVNTEETKASLLKAYHMYVGTTDISRVPSPNEYRSFDGDEYTIIKRTTNSKGEDRVVIEASKGCLFGDDEFEDIPHFQKGFDNETVKPCYLITTLYADFDFLLMDLKTNNGDHMRLTANEIWYYSVNRSSTASLWIHITGKFLPDTSVAMGTYENVESSDLKRISFSTPKFEATSLDVGEIVGVRVLMSTTSNGLSDPYALHSTYFDIRPYSHFDQQFAEFTSNLANGQFFFFRAVAIRHHPDFVDNTSPKRFLGLGPGEYLSAGSNTTALKVLVPPMNHVYFHDLKAVVDRNMTGSMNPSKFSEASARCTGRKIYLKDPADKQHSYKLINHAVWNRLLITPEATIYNNMDAIPHWLSDAPASIDAEFGELDGFMPDKNSQTIIDSKVFYIRNSANPSAPVNHVMGGIPQSPYRNFWSLVFQDTNFASSRCMISL